MSNQLQDIIFSSSESFLCSVRPATHHDVDVPNTRLNVFPLKSDGKAGYENCDQVQKRQ